MGALSIWHILILAVVALVLFGGRGKISDLMGDVAQGIKAFKKGMSDDDKTAEADPKTIDHKADAKPADAKPADAKSAGDPMKQHADTERKFESTT